MFFISVTAPQGATVGYTDADVRQVEAILQPLLDERRGGGVFAIIGRTASRIRAFVVVRLADLG